MLGECRETPRGISRCTRTVGPPRWGNEQERNTLPLYSHFQGALQYVDGKPWLIVKAGDQPADEISAKPFLCSHIRCSASVAPGLAFSCSASVALASAVKLCRLLDPLAQLRGFKVGISQRYGSIDLLSAATYFGAGFSTSSSATFAAQSGHCAVHSLLPHTAARTV